MNYAARDSAKAGPASRIPDMGVSPKRVESRHPEGAARSNPVINSIPDCFASLAMTT
jgi:hypothetical protein